MVSHQSVFRRLSLEPLTIFVTSLRSFCTCLPVRPSFPFSSYFVVVLSPPPPSLATGFLVSGVQNMLVFDPQRRVSAKDAMEHPYFENLNAAVKNAGQG